MFLPLRVSLLWAGHLLQVHSVWRNELPRIAKGASCSISTF